MIESILLWKKESAEYEDRLIDVDILLYGDLVLSQPDLHIPHLHLPDRRFSLVPLAEILPEFEHPVLRKKISTLLTECTDELPVERIEMDYPEGFKQG